MAVICDDLGGLFEPVVFKKEAEFEACVVALADVRATAYSFLLRPSMHLERAVPFAARLFLIRRPTIGPD